MCECPYLFHILPHLWHLVGALIFCAMLFSDWYQLFGTLHCPLMSSSHLLLGKILVLPPLPLPACPMHGPDQLTQVTDHNLSTFEELNLFQLLVVSTETGNVSFVQSGNSVQQHREQWGNLRILHTSEKDHIDSPLPTLVHSCAHSTHNPKLYFYNVKLEALKSFKLINA